MAVFDCNFCGDAILDQHIFQVDDKVWHENCIKCASCKCQLTEKCFAKNGVLYCRKDFARIFGSKCAGCGSAIFDSDLVQKLRSNGEVKLLYHADCLCCSQCRCKFQPGSEVYFSSVNKALCFQDFSSAADSRLTEDCIESPESEPCARTPTPKENCPQNSQTEQQQANINAFADDLTTCESWTGDLVDAPIHGDSVDSSVSSGDSIALCVPVTKRRGPRTTIKAKQLDSLKAAFAATPKPTRHIREQLAQDTGLSMRVIQVWFQNRRSKERRIKQMNVLGGRRHIFERNLPRHMQLNHGPQNQQHPANMQCFFPENSIYQPNYNHGVISETGGLHDPYPDLNVDQVSAWNNQSPTNPSAGGLVLSQCGQLGSYPVGEGENVYYGPGETSMVEPLCRKNADPLVKSEMQFWNHN